MSNQSNQYGITPGPRECATLYTKRQILGLLAAWGKPREVPSKGKPHRIDFGVADTYLHGLISWTDKQSPAGDRLYQVLFTNDLPALLARIKGETV